jgi:hypothetical protein
MNLGEPTQKYFLEEGAKPSPLSNRCRCLVRQPQGLQSNSNLYDTVEIVRNQ